MTRPFQRRQVVRWLGAVAFVLLPGCGQPERAPWRELSFGEIQVEETEDGWVVTFELQKQHQGPDELKAFHDVRVHGYDRSRTEVCSKKIGTITEPYHGGDGLSVELECSEFPTMLTYSAAESPCDEEINTELAVATYDEADGWKVVTYRGCNEGLPPEPGA